MEWIWIAAIIVIALIVVIRNIRVVQQSQAYVIERLGAFSAVWGVGIHIKIPFLERVAKRVSLKEQVLDYPPQPVITKDNVTMQIDTVVYFQITDPKLYAYGVEQPMMAMETLTATTLRNIIGDLELDQTLTSRDVINTKMRAILDEATDRLKKGGFLTPILIGEVEEVKAAAAAGNFDVEGVEIIDPATYPEMDAMVEKMVALRKGKMTAEDCRKALSKGNYFGTMLVKMGYADALLGGATYSTADTVRPALQLVKTKAGAHLVSSCFILVRGEEKLAMGDCAINIDYQDTVDKDGNVVVSAAQKLAEVAVETARTAKVFGIDPKVAVLSFSTKGSGKGGTVQLSHDATVEAQKLAPELAIDGELQFDAAVSPVVAATKCKGSPVAGQANTFIFPCIEAGNIGYKIAQRLGGYEAYGPILQGLNAPINDLSRGCNADEVYKMAIITAALA